MNRQELTEAITRSGGKQNALDEADALWERIDCLQQTGRYGTLLSQLARANDKNNFLALVLEVNFAYRFESHELELTYEIKQNRKHRSSIDFLRQMPGGECVFFEVRLLQQPKSVADSIRAQLRNSKFYRVLLHALDEKTEVVRIQNTILSKVQDKYGKPIKFFSQAAHAVNIVVVDVTENILGMIDVHDCKLVAYGDPAVEEAYRRQVFGLFQEVKPEYPQRIRDLANRYAHIRRSLHGFLFLFKKRGNGLLVYDLDQYLMWNAALIDEARARPVFTEIASVIPERCDAP